jgi:hypothetical protein
MDADMDDDGLNDGLELWLFKTNVDNADTDNDLLNDYDECRIYNSDAFNSDSDFDGIIDGIEVHQYNTDPLQMDTDGDSLDDLWEINNNHNPLVRDNWDNYLGVYIIIPSIVVVFVLVAIFASVSISSNSSFSFKSLFEKRIDQENQQLQLLEILALIPENQQVDINELAEISGEPVEVIHQLLSSVVTLTDDENSLSQNNIIIHSHNSTTNFNISCFYCGENIDIEAEECPHCKEAIVRCKQCNNPIAYDDAYATCASYGVFGEQDDVYGYMTLELICETCLMNNRFHYI